GTSAIAAYTRSSRMPAWRKRSTIAKRARVKASKGGLDCGEWGEDMLKSKGKYQKAKGKRQKSIRKQSHYLIQILKTIVATEGNKRKIKCRPFAF
ncbi:MAG TPA: hypothetical protein VFZ34_05670, partial [Blastocatellia bacterium]|nr:hypothetical protein [Blastocatellia bacterium]